MTQDGPPAKPKLSSPEQRQRRDERTAAIRLRFMISRYLDEQGIATPAPIGEVLGMPVEEATKLLARHQWREGDLERLQAAAARLKL